ncbi:uncharacterized protein LOC136025027 isoform X3 [Artemia franciscana]|nr:hypothetical protein QYM36_011036 [Artemia franciscana]
MDLGKSLSKIQVLCVYTYYFVEFIEVFAELMSGCKELRSFYLNYAVKGISGISLQHVRAMERILGVNLKLAVLKVVTCTATLYSGMLGAIFVDKIIASCLSSAHFENSASFADRGVFRCLWNEPCTSILADEQIRDACYQGTYGTETRAAAFCVLSIPPFNRHNENKEFMGKILSLCLHNNSEHVYLFQLLSHHTHLEQLRLTSRMQSSSNAPALLFFDHELLTNSLCRLTNIIALELTFSHSLWLEGMTHALKCLISLKRLRIVPCILVDKFKTVHSETEAVSFKRPRIERTLKEYSSLLKDLCENTPDLEVIEIIPSVHCCSICSNVELSFVCRDLAHLRNLRHLTLQNLVLYDASFFREVSMSCKKFESLTLKGIKATYTERFARHLLPVLPQLTALKHLVWDQGYAKNSSEVICALTKLSNLERVALIYNSRAVSSEKIGPVLELIQNNRKLEGLFCVFGKSSEKACKSCSKAINEYRKRSGRWNLFSLIQNKYLHNDCGGEYLDLMPFYLYQDWIVQPSKVVLQPDVMKV